VAGADWPNTVAPPAPVVLTVHGGELELPTLVGEFPEPTFTAGAERSSESVGDTTWEIRDDVLRRTTYARTHTVSDYATAYDGRAREDYLGEVSVDRRTHEQHAHAITTFDLTWPEAVLQVRSRMDVSINVTGIDVEIETVATRDGSVVSTRTWREQIPGRG
jgi:hypothetical protein